MYPRSETCPINYLTITLEWCMTNIYSRKEHDMFITFFKNKLPISHKEHASPDKDSLKLHCYKYVFAFLRFNFPLSMPK